MRTPATEVKWTVMERFAKMYSSYWIIFRFCAGGNLLIFVEFIIFCFTFSSEILLKLKNDKSAFFEEVIRPLNTYTYTVGWMRVVQRCILMIRLVCGIFLLN